ncbi:hypothetical protein LC040_12155 [Bacillus tianshenii]|nr:hypothetical protein LC040_12155 [Bacillus tianshenii]
MLSANALTTVATAISYLGIYEEDNVPNQLIERAINVASSTIEGYCNRKFKLQQHTEVAQATHTNMLLLKQYPVQDVFSIDGETNTNVTLMKEEGMLYRKAEWKEDTVVEYTAGYVLPNDTENVRTLPYDLEDACLQLIGSVFFDEEGKEDEQVTSEKIGDWSVSYAKISTIGVGGITDTVKSVLERYRRYPI